MLTGAQQHAADRFAKSLLALSDDALIDTYHQAVEDHKAAQTEVSDNIANAYTQMLACEKAMRDRFSDYPTRGFPLAARDGRARPPGESLDETWVALAATGPPTPSIPHICRRADVREPA